MWAFKLLSLLLGLGAVGLAAFNKSTIVPPEWFFSGAYRPTGAVSDQILVRPFKRDPSGQTTCTGLNHHRLLVESRTGNRPIVQSGASLGG